MEAGGGIKCALKIASFYDIDPLYTIVLVIGVTQAVCNANRFVRLNSLSFDEQDLRHVVGIEIFFI